MPRTVMAGKWSLHRLTATVINDIAVEITFFSIWSLGATKCAHPKPRVVRLIALSCSCRSHFQVSDRPGTVPHFRGARPAERSHARHLSTLGDLVTNAHSTGYCARSRCVLPNHLCVRPVRFHVHYRSNNNQLIMMSITFLAIGKVCAPRLGF